MQNTKDPIQQQKMFDIIVDWQKSHQSQKSFCEQKGIPPWQFYYWFAKFRKQNQQSGDFIPIHVNGPTSSAIEISYPNGILLKLPLQTNVATLKSLVSL